MDAASIADYGLLSDCRSAALVSRGGSVDWLCLPSFDSPSVCARLLDDGGGHCAIRPTGAAEITRRYLDRTMALETTFRTDSGTMVLVDALAVGRNNRGHDLGAGSPGVLMRRARCTEGEIELELAYAPRPEYGLIHPLLNEVAGGVGGRGGADALILSSPVPLTIERATATAGFRLRAGEQASFALHHAWSWEPDPTVWTPDEITGRLHDTVEGWRTWPQMHQRYDGRWRDLVHHSGRVLQAACSDF